MKRRQFLAGVGLAALGGVAPARAADVKKVALLWRTAEGSLPGADPRDVGRQLESQSRTREEAARDIAARLEPFGFRLHRNLEIQWFDIPAVARFSRTLPAVVSRMVAAKPDCIMVDGPVASYVVEATRSIPVVTYVRDPVAGGLAKSIARPGGNVTGLHGGVETIDLKSIEFLRRAMPAMSCVGWIGVETQHIEFGSFESKARDAGLEVRKVVVSFGQEGWQSRLEAQFRPLRAARCTGALLALPIPSVIEEVAKLALRHGIAVALVADREREAESDGVLLRYGIADDQKDIEGRLAAIVARVLKGEKPADIPFEGPSRFRLALNLRTARKIGVTIPPDMRVLAERIIE